MDHKLSENFGSSTLHSPLPEESILIIGAGHFGRRAARILCDVRLRRKPLFIIDREGEKLAKITGSSIERIRSDGIEFLVKNAPFLRPANLIIPAIPVHLSAVYLKICLH
jgi:saccharopine dehydrogenase-like NADP-dependent oxidoreductase